MADETAEMNKLKADIEALRKDFSALGETLKEISMEQAHSVRNQAHKASKNLEREIQERPLTSVLAAVGIGFLIGKLMDR